MNKQLFKSKINMIWKKLDYEWLLQSVCSVVGDELINKKGLEMVTRDVRKLMKSILRWYY